MNQKELESFELGIALARALNGDNKAIADLPLLYQRHPEMFKDMKDLIETIEKVVQDPDLVMKNPSPHKRTDDEVLAAKKLNDKKMGDVVIKNDKGTNVIFHANKINVEKFKNYEKKQAMVGTPNSYIQAQSLDERLVQKNISSPAKEIIPKNSKEEKKQALQYLRDNKPNIDSKESKHSSKDKSSKESSNQSSKLLDPNKQNKSENKSNTRKQRK